MVSYAKRCLKTLSHCTACPVETSGTLTPPKLLGRLLELSSSKSNKKDKLTASTTQLTDWLQRSKSGLFYWYLISSFCLQKET